MSLVMWVPVSLRIFCSTCFVLFFYHAAASRHLAKYSSGLLSRFIIIIIVIIIVTGRPWENRLNWIPDPAPATSRDHGIEQSPLSTGPEGPKEEKENRPPLHLIHPGYPGRCDPGGESGHSRSIIFQGPMRIRLELTSDPGG